MRSNWPLAGLLALPLIASGQSPSSPVVEPPSTADGGVPSTSQEGVTAVQEKVGFQDAVQRALARNPDALTASKEIARFHALMEETRASALPTITLNGTYTRLDNDRTLGTSDGGSIVVQGKDSFNGNATLAVPILAPRVWANWTRAEDAVAVSRASEAQVRRAVAISTARAYLTVFAQKRTVDVQLRARENAGAHVEYTRRRLEGGIGNRIDATRAAQELAFDEATLSNSYSSLYRAQESLGILLGIEKPVDVSEEPDFSPLPSAEAALESAPTSRADLKALEERRRTADHSLNLSYTEYLPTITLTGAPFYQNPASLTTPQTGWQASALFSWAFFDGGYRYGVTHEREALLAEAKIALDGGLRQANSEARAAADAVGRAANARESSRKGAQYADEALRLAEIAYRAGASTNIELIDAQRSARDAESQAVVAEDSARQAALDLLAAAGKFP